MLNLPSRPRFQHLPTHTPRNLDPLRRRMIFGPLRPMDCDLSWWERLFSR